MVNKISGEDTKKYTDNTDEEIIEIIRKGDEVAQDFILNKFKPLVKSKARTFFLIGADKEDIIQEGMIGLYKAIRDFKPERNSSFRAFAELCVNRQMITAIKTASRQKHIPLNSYISLNKPIYENNENAYIEFIDNGEISSPESLFIDREEKKYIEENIGEALSRFELKVLALYLQGKSYVEISTEIERSEKSIDNALQRVKKKIEKLKTK